MADLGKAQNDVQDSNFSISWAGALPQAQGLYDPAFEKDSCGVGFVCHIKGQPSHEIVADARNLLCNMTHRGAVGADTRDGDGAGVMCGIPHRLFATDVKRNFGIVLPPPGQYAVGNIYFKPDETVIRESQEKFEDIARSLGLFVLCWRPVPRDNSILGPSSKSKEPAIYQPFITVQRGAGAMYNTPINYNNVAMNNINNTSADFDEMQFERQLYLLRKQSTHALTLIRWFYICSLSSRHMVYKGLLSPVQVYPYFADLTNPDFASHFCLVHSRFSTNTFPSWDRAQPMRWCAHNGEINTLRGNKNWQRAREGVMRSEAFKDHLDTLLPIIEEGGSDSAAFDNVLELLIMNGAVSLPEAVMMMIPEAWENQPHMEPEKRAFYEWAACLMEPWDGPALFTFSDGRYVGASLDRNGLRPCRFYITDKDIMICASEVGTIAVDTASITTKGRLRPGKMLLVDTQEGRVVDDTELKMRIATQKPYAKWIKENMISMTDVCMFYQHHASHHSQPGQWFLDETSVSHDKRMLAFGFTIEQLNMLMLPMVADGKEALGSMGYDTPLACMSRQPKLPYEYFRQLFAQVTNPPIDPIREDIVMSLSCYIGPQGNILEVEEGQAHRLHLPSPMLSIDELAAIKALPQFRADWSVAEIDITFMRAEGAAGYLSALDRVCSEVSQAIHDGLKIAILTDRQTSADRVPLSALVALGGVHHHLVRNRLRSKIALIVETGEAREVHHFCVLLGYGADAICPYLALEAMLKLKRDNIIKNDITDAKIIYNFMKASNDGIRKVMSKMGISTLQSYKAAQIFEALGLDPSVVSKCFSGTASRIKGVGFDILALDTLALHEAAWPSRETVSLDVLPEPGDFHWRDGGESHINDPSSIANLQDAVKRKNETAYETYSRNAYEQIKNCTLRGLLDFRFDVATPVPIEEVEPWQSIVKRFCTGAMSYGSISYEAHSALAVAMNKLGGKSNTGEGGEDPARSKPGIDGQLARSAIKQVASGRFGVTSYYLSDAEELQIKLAQGAKPGEGGELPGHKVSESIAATRKSTPGVGLISPPPHHDIYSIEDLKQLIYDLKCANPLSRVSVKLVSEVGVGVIAAGVAKARADHILISGHDGGTGASRWTGIKYAGLPWELGLAETHQTLVLNDLRGRVVLQTDGQIKTGRDVAVACLLGAEEWGFATAPLIAMGCIMMRKCHLNTCPVGIATQDPELRKKFEGTPEDVINFFYFVAEECRSIMARLGFRTIEEMVGRTDYLTINESAKNPKTRNLDLTPILTPAFLLRPGAATHNVKKQDHKLDLRLDNGLIEKAKKALEHRRPVEIFEKVVNTDRALGTTLSYEVSKQHGEQGLPDGTIRIKLEGSAGQSLGAFLAPGIQIDLEGDANDYVGKGLSGGRIVVYPPANSVFKAEQNIVVGNVCLYGATAGTAFFSGIAAERFAVRNSGATAVVEGVGDHGCEYMTGGRIVILGETGRNFAAGMSGGIAYVLDATDTFERNCNMEMVDLDRVTEAEESLWLKSLIEEHSIATGSALGRRIIADWPNQQAKFVRVFPRDYRAALEKKKAAEQEAVAKRLELETEKGIHDYEQPRRKEDAEQVQIMKALEPKVADLEDSIMDESMAKKRVEVLDKVRGFMKYKREGDRYRNPRKRVKDWKEISARLPDSALKTQAARCMDCGVPFCQSDNGCPIGNIIPKWNELVFKDNWREALDRLLLTNNFPEFTGRVCPAPCEGACVLGINELPVSIKSIECAIIDRGFAEGWIVPSPPKHRTGKRIAIVGSGPAGLAAADQLNKAGHLVTVYERNDRVGGLLMYGIPNMKLDKGVVQRRIDLMEAEGIKFITNAHVGKTVSARTLREENDAVLVATGATWPRDLPVPNRNLDGIHFAMEFLERNTKRVLSTGDVRSTSNITEDEYLSAKGKNVVVIGGGDTGCDCIATSMRHGATQIVNFELLPQPPPKRDSKSNPWPTYPRVFKMEYGHAEVAVHHGNDPRRYCVLTKEFVSDGKGRVAGINIVKVEWTKDPTSGAWRMKEVPGSEEFVKADLVLLAMGFLGPENEVIKQLELAQDNKTNIKTGAGVTGQQHQPPAQQAPQPAQGQHQISYATASSGVFAAGDCRRGQSLIVWAINEGRQSAREIDVYLMGNTRLPVPGGMVEQERRRRWADPTAEAFGEALAWPADGRGPVADSGAVAVGGVGMGARVPVIVK
ncbi:uncharacterized protein EV422DRAFT_3637 [Fimicolochytrium jonesii]|uniref:uncharacterized protein n=1 Tax=Fimicolochytrium jonesii TaxID=1396493 RepID=UPI0022FE6305|nr:uncharacterized protein EV422DRAFT_3637 [Fimicolochytrium jonesii]KAI8826607.1 hypothetical protein EV422DRAFT_3637 [Fimicolochytrium jonesii]